MKLQQAAQRLRFGGLREVEGRATVADLLPAGRRTGIYILGFRTGEAYAGLSVDIVARFVQHARTHSDIVSFAAKAVPHRHLDAEETHVIERLERWGFRLRNIAKASIPSIESDLDALLTVRDQERFVRTGTVWLPNLTTPLLRDLRRRYLRRFGELMRAWPSSFLMRSLHRQPLRFRSGLPLLPLVLVCTSGSISTGRKF